jgi:hypothetical protein
VLAVTMAEHWKSTPKYYCDRCQCYVRDTKLERQNHEATARHQGNLKRYVRDIHKKSEREEREKERARQEIARITGVTSGSASTNTSFKPPGGQHGSSSSAPTAASLKKQREQLAELGVAMPEEFRGDMAIPGEWSTVSTRVIKDEPEETKIDAKATGVRKREAPEEEKDAEDALQNLFKKQKRWGRDSKTAPAEKDEDLEALLSGSIVTKTEAEHSPPLKKEEGLDTKEQGGPEVKDELPTVKEEAEATTGLAAVPVKSEEAGLEAPVKTEEGTGDAPPATGVVFKKRKPKQIRQK